MRKILFATAAIAVGLLLLSGAEVNPVQGIIAMPLVGVGVYILRSIDAASDEKSENLPKREDYRKAA